MAAAQQEMEQQANKKKDPAFLYREGDLVWLDLENVGNGSAVEEARRREGYTTSST
ncbi:hypothetical protein ACJ73_04894 [Blastomyces percursus]|uniref:Uncharacterized protein n=1 Tax=Blastomyces percursus TaxID=1658174 RepID=A0A1J9Q5J5_9EURO|nr:hypothetical protein ACJ73_04894 [Blastomyces percursus]